MLHDHFYGFFGAVREIGLFNVGRCREVLTDERIFSKLVMKNDDFGRFTGKKIIFFSVRPGLVIEGTNLKLVILVVVDVETVARSTEKSGSADWNIWAFVHELGWKAKLRIFVCALELQNEPVASVNFDCDSIQNRARSICEIFSILGEDAQAVQVNLNLGSSLILSFKLLFLVVLCTRGGYLR